MATTTAVCRDGMEAEPFTAEELAGLRRALRFHDSTGTVPRLVATIDQMTPTLASVPGGGEGACQCGQSDCGGVDFD